MYPPSRLPEEFNTLRHTFSRVTVQSLLHRTLDHERGLLFRSFGGEGDRRCQGSLRAHCKGSAIGLAGLDYPAVLAVPSNCLRDLSRLCIDDSTVPHAWLIAITAAVKKPDKGLKDLESYWWAVGLKSCFLKTPTSMGLGRGHGPHITAKVASARGTGRLTMHSCYAHSSTQRALQASLCLPVVLPDLTHAFPSVNQPTLWIHFSGGVRRRRSSTSCMPCNTGCPPQQRAFRRGARGNPDGRPCLSHFLSPLHPQSFAYRHHRRLSYGARGWHDTGWLSSPGARDELSQFCEYAANTFVLKNIRLLPLAVSLSQERR